MQELEKILEEIEEEQRSYEADHAWNYARGLEHAADIIRKHMNDGWIPVEERLPTMEEYQKDDGRFILDDGNRRCAGYFNVYTGRFYLYRHITQYMAELHENNWVIAWRPLPEPYRPERSESKAARELGKEIISGFEDGIHQGVRENERD